MIDTENMNAMLDIFSIRYPFKILNAIILLVSVFVIGLQFLRTWTDEGRENQFVNFDALYFSFFTKNYLQIPVHVCGTKDATFPAFGSAPSAKAKPWNSTDAPNVAGFIKPFIIGDFFTDFHVWSLA